MRKALSSRRKGDRRKARSTACLLLLFLCVTGTSAQAEEIETESTQTTEQSAAFVVNARSSEDGVFLYLKNMGADATVSSAQIGNTACRSVQTGALSETGLPVRTVILLDNSISLGNRWGEEAVSLLEQMIDRHAEGELFRIATFSEEVTELSGYSDDYEALKSAIGQITFENQDTYLSEMLYTCLKDAQDNAANYTRFLIVADGADDQEISYTQAELTDLMNEAAVTIHTVGIRGKNNEALLETLFSYSRLTNGTYTLVEEESDPADVCGIADADYRMRYVRLVPEEADLDGSRKEIRVSLAPEGTELRTSVIMPLAPAREKEEPAPEAKEEVEEPEQPAPLPVIQTEPVNEERRVVPVGLLLLIAVLIAGGVAGLILILRKRSGRIGVIQTVDSKNEPSEHRTRLLAVEEMPQHYLTLQDIANPARCFRAPMMTRVAIGRTKGDLLISDDEAVSGEQCEIVKKGSLYYLKDLNSSNGTYYGGNRIYSEVPIINGGEIGFGGHKYKIELE